MPQAYFFIGNQPDRPAFRKLFLLPKAIYYRKYRVTHKSDYKAQEVMKEVI